jgi:hypothetical protein
MGVGVKIQEIRGDLPIVSEIRAYLRAYLKIASYVRSRR